MTDYSDFITCICRLEYPLQIASKEKKRYTPNWSGVSQLAVLINVFYWFKQWTWISCHRKGRRSISPHQLSLSFSNLCSYIFLIMQLDPSRNHFYRFFFSEETIYLFFTIMIGYLHVDVVYAAQDFKDLCLCYL